MNITTYKHTLASSIIVVIIIVVVVIAAIISIIILLFLLLLLLLLFIILLVVQTDACYNFHGHCPHTWRNCSAFRITKYYWRRCRKPFGKCKLSV